MDIPASAGRHWLVPPRDPAAEQRLRAELGVTPLVAATLVARGLSDPAEAHTFLNPCLDDLSAPELLPDYAAARDEILGAKERNDKIFIHGDYDVDGVTSAALLSRFLTKIGCDVVTHVPHRMKEGYGIHSSAVEAAAASGAKLFLTCDCGGSAIEQVAQARELGMKVVVTDHHSLGEELPQADAVVNPHRVGSRYPFAELSGAGVVFRLCEGLATELGFEKSHYRRAYLDLAALGTIADVMPLVGENRIISRFGLQELSKTKKIGLKAMMAEAKMTPGMHLRGYHVGFVLGPRLNAAGRVDDAAKALQLLLSTDVLESAKLAAEIECKNQERKDEQHRILGEAIELVQEQGAHEKNVIVIAKQGWHTGVIGIVAGRLVEIFRRPTFVLSLGEDGFCKGSARSIPKFHLADAIRAYPELLVGGGHAMAAGCSFPHERLADVVAALHAYAGERLTEEDFIPSMWADAEIAASEVTRESAEELGKLEPFGCANPEPMFIARDMTLAEVAPTRKPEHVRTLLRSEHGTVAAMGFNMGEQITTEMIGAKVDVAFQPMLDEYRGIVTLKWRLQDLQASSSASVLPVPEPLEVPALA
ncbi:MAG: single-stranded-DNA-specific exonuclease [Fimbriimonadaceae bacterium]|jgi:single-stranded-DNA-specific exonuclease|nr:single-stranded-DNA-specific exonuclease [Fimbriimonadaceae bacterium]